MAEFDAAYSSLYDRLYAESKDYGGEMRFVETAWSRFSRLASEQAGPRAILDLGCGSGRHLAAAGDAELLVGVDRSPTMIAAARDAAPRARFEVAEIADVHIGTTFDLVFSLFHVLSYQTTVESLRGFFRTVEVHLRTDGVAVADFWHRGAWEMDPPGVRVRQSTAAGSEMVRLAESSHDSLTGVVEIDINVFLRSAGDTSFTLVSEQHRMRSYTALEVSLAAEMEGLRILHMGSWMDPERRLSAEDWYGWIVLAKGSTR